MRKLEFVFILLFCSILGYSQYSPLKIRCKGEYLHQLTGTIFPLEIENCKRSEMYSFNKENSNIGVIYEDKTDDDDIYENKNVDKKTKFTVYLYPADDGTEDRLRDEYLKSLQSIAAASNKGLHATQEHVFFKSNSYKINGYKATIKDIKGYSSLVVYECGRWFFKVRLTTNYKDSIICNNIERKIMDYFNPTNLVKKFPLNPLADISFAKAAFVDSIMLGSAMGSAYKKVNWAYQNVDSLERASGFPGLYLKLHIESLKEFLEFEKKHPNMKQSKKTKEYLNELKLIVNSGYLAEFIMEQYNMLMIVPDDIKLDFAGFDNWKRTHSLKIDLNERYYVIWYNQVTK